MALQNRSFSVGLKETVSPRATLTLECRVEEQGPGSAPVQPLGGPDGSLSNEAMYVHGAVDGPQI